MIRANSKGRFIEALDSLIKCLVSGHGNPKVLEKIVGEIKGIRNEALVTNFLEEENAKYKSLKSAADSLKNLYSLGDYDSVMYVEKMLSNYLAKSLRDSIDNDDYQSVKNILQDKYLQLDSQELRKKVSKYLLDKLITSAGSNNFEQFSDILTRKELNIDEDAYKKLRENIGDETYIQKLKESILGHESYPDHYICALLAKRVYIEKDKDHRILPEFNKLMDGVESSRYKDFEKLLSKWKILESSNKDSDHYGAIYVNYNERKLVLAHKGTSVPKDLNIDYHSIVKGNPTKQQREAYELTKKALEKIQPGGELEGWSLTIVGHSLGAWLAQLSLFHAHKALKDPTNVRAVVFDSPGALEMLNNINSNVEGKRINLKNLDLVEYLSAPNAVNCLGKHIGDVYRVYNEDIKVEGSFRDFILKRLKESLSGHALNHILNTFKEDNRPENYKVVVNWPLVEYKGEKGSSPIATILKKPFKAFLQEATILTGLRFLSKALDKKMNTDQLIVTLASTTDYFDTPKELTPEEEHKLLHEGNYETEAIRGPIKINKGKHGDIIKLDKIISKATTHLVSLDNNLDSSTLKGFVDLFQITKENDGTYTFELNPEALDRRGLDIHRIKEIAQHLIRYIHLDKLVEFEPSPYPQVIIETAKALMHLSSDIVPVESDDKFVDRVDEGSKLARIADKLANYQEVIVHGLTGTGKSFTAEHYARKNYDKIFKIPNIGSIEEIYAKYILLANELGIEKPNGQSSGTRLSESYIRDNQINQVNKAIKYLIDVKGEKIAFVLDDCQNGYELYTKQSMQELLTKLKHIGVDIITTTQDGRFGANPEYKSKSINLEGFDKDEAIKYLSDNILSEDGTSRFNEADLTSLLENTDNLPTSLPKVLSAMVDIFNQDNSLTIQDYLEEYEEEKGCIEGVDPAFKILLEKVASEQPVAWKLLQYTSYLSSAPIPKEIFKGILSAAKLRKVFSKGLLPKSLVDTSGPEGTFTIHDMVRDSIGKYRGYLNESSIESLDEPSPELLDEKEVINNLLEIMKNKLDIFAGDDFRQTVDWQNKLAEVEPYVPHAQKLLEQPQGSDELSAQLYYRLGEYHKETLSFKEAYKKFKGAIRIAKGQEEEDRDQGFIAKVYQAMGDTYIQEGKDLLNIISVEESYQKIKDYLTPGTYMLGHLPEGISSEERQDIMKHQHNLFQISFYWGSLEAERGIGKNIESIIKGNEGSSPADLYKKASKYIKKAIEITENYLLVDQDPSISTYENLADNYRKIGDKESALTYYSKALEEYKNVLPEEWHEVIVEYQEIVNNQEVEQPIGYCQDFLSFLRDTQSSVFPVSRKTIKDAYVKLGDIYYELNNLEKAAKYYNKALELKGSEQEDATLKEIIGAYKRYGESCQDKEEAIESYKEALGLLRNPPINLAYQFSYHLNSKFLPPNKHELAVKLYERAFNWVKDQGILRSFTTSTDKEIKTELKQVPLEGFDNTLFEALKGIGDYYVKEGGYELAIKHYAGTFELIIPNELHLFSRTKGYQYFSSLDYKEMSMLYSSLGLDEGARECLRSQRKPGIPESTIRPLYLETKFKELLQTIYEKTKQGIYSERGGYDLNSYLEDDHLKDKLKGLGEKVEKYQMNCDIEKVQLLMLKYVSMAVIHGGMKKEQIEVLKSLAKDHVTLIFQARESAVSYFLDKRLVEVLREVKFDYSDSYENSIRQKEYQGALCDALKGFILKEIYEPTIKLSNGLKDILYRAYTETMSVNYKGVKKGVEQCSKDEDKLLVLKYVSKAIVDSGMEHIGIIEALAKDYKELIIKAAQERPDYFLDKKIVEHLLKVHTDDNEYQDTLAQILAEDASVEEMEVDEDSATCKIEAGEGQNKQPDGDDDGDNAPAGGGSSGNAATTSSSQAGQASSSTSGSGGRSNNGSSNKESGTTDNETPPSKSALLAVVAEIESYGALIHDERLKVQLEHYAKTGVVYKTLAPYVEAAESAHPALFIANTTQENSREEQQGNRVHITQELVDKIVGSIAERAGITYDEKLAAQAQHFLNTGNIYDTLHAYLHPQRLVEEVQQREAEEQVHEYNQTNTTTCATEVRVPASEHEAPSYIDLAS